MEQSLLDTYLDAILKEIEDSRMISRSRLGDALTAAHAVWTARNSQPLVTEDVVSSHDYDRERGKAAVPGSTYDKMVEMLKGASRGPVYPAYYSGLDQEHRDAAIKAAYHIWHSLSFHRTVSDRLGWYELVWRDSNALNCTQTGDINQTHPGWCILERECEIAGKNQGLQNLLKELTDEQLKTAFLPPNTTHYIPDPQLATLTHEKEIAKAPTDWKKLVAAYQALGSSNYFGLRTKR